MRAPSSGSRSGGSATVAAPRMRRRRRSSRSGDRHGRTTRIADAAHRGSMRWLATPSPTAFGARRSRAAELARRAGRRAGPVRSRPRSSWTAWQVHRALETLPEHERPVIELAYWRGLSQREIAELLDIPLGTVKTRTRSALARLADTLEGGARVTVRPPNFDELVGTDLDPRERDRLHRVHELLLAAGPPPDFTSGARRAGGDRDRARAAAPLPRGVLAPWRPRSRYSSSPSATSPASAATIRERSRSSG